MGDMVQVKKVEGLRKLIEYNIYICILKYMCPYNECTFRYDICSTAVVIIHLQIHVISSICVLFIC